MRITRWSERASSLELRAWLVRTHAARMAAYLALALVVRIALVRDFPAFLTSDSGDYITAASAIFSHLDYANAGLRDWRLPGYPTFLALVFAVAGGGSQAIVFVQAGLGMLAVLLALAAGRLSGSRLVTEVLVVFVAFNPAYLLHDHLIMAEGLFLVLLLATAVVAFWSLREIISWPEGLILGALCALCLLTRANGVAACAALAGGAVALRAVRRAPSRGVAPGNWAGFAVGALVIIGLALAAWSYRNIRLYDVPTPFTANGWRNLVIYAAQHDLLDRNAPALQPYAVAYEPGNPAAPYRLVAALGSSPADAEASAAHLLAAQVAARPARYAVEAVRAAAGFAGFGSAALDPGQDDLRWWFRYVVGDVGELNQNNAAAVFDPEATPFRNQLWGRDSTATRLWSRLGEFFLRAVRPVISVLFLIALAAFALRTRLRPAGPADAVVWMCALAYLGTIALHALSLSDYDRFAVSFDWLAVLAASLAFSRLRLR